MGWGAGDRAHYCRAGLGPGAGLAAAANHGFHGVVFQPAGPVVGHPVPARIYFTLGLLSNKPLLGTVALTIGLLLIIFYTLFFNDLFNTQPLTVAELGITVAVSSLVFG